MEVIESVNPNERALVTGELRKDVLHDKSLNIGEPTGTQRQPCGAESDPWQAENDRVT